MTEKRPRRKRKARVWRGWVACWRIVGGPTFERLVVWGTEVPVDIDSIKVEVREVLPKKVKRGK